MKNEPATRTSVEWIWRHFAITLPSNWEMLQFSTEYSRGRCAFADRYQFRAELSWKVVTGEPDYGRMVKDYTQRLESEKKIESPSGIIVHGWHGFHGNAGRGEMTRLGKYMPANKCLLELVLIWPDARDRDLEDSIAASIREVGPDQHNRYRWRAFGMQIDVPVRAAISGCTAMPGLVDVHFNDPKTGNTLQFKRAGMLSAWFDGDIESWLKKTVGPTRDPVVRRRTDHNQEFFLLEGSYKPEGLHIRKGQVNASAWLSRSDQRLYCALMRTRKPDLTRSDAPADLLRAAPEFMCVP